MILLNEQDLKLTPLTNMHKLLGATMIDFAGWLMPLKYGPSAIKEHIAVRNSAGIFDVSHMLQLQIVGDCESFCKHLERVSPSSFQDLKDMRCKYSVLLNNDGGIEDDFIFIKRSSEDIRLILNANCYKKDLDILSSLPGNQVVRNDAMIALQGPLSASVMVSSGFNNLPEKKNQSADGQLFGVAVFASRIGYTGEDGFEIIVPKNKANIVWEGLMEHKFVSLAGLGARDSLRLEAGYPLYGLDINSSISPAEANLSWLVKRFDCIGGKRLEQDRDFGPKIIRLGIVSTGKRMLRPGLRIMNPINNEDIGQVTSSTFSPFLNKPIGQGIISSEFIKSNNKEVLVYGENIKIPCLINNLSFLDKN